MWIYILFSRSSSRGCPNWVENWPVLPLLSATSATFCAWKSLGLPLTQRDSIANICPKIVERLLKNPWRHVESPETINILAESFNKVSTFFWRFSTIFEHF
jgi:hypothetical protein